MSTLGTFDSFTTARLGIYASQHGLSVTGNNISNINTSGYTRQRIDQVSFKTGTSDRYASFLDNHVGSGALVTGINQIRDPFLDIRYRTTSTDTSYYDTKLDGLQDIAAILDEVGKGENKGDGLLYKELQELADQLRRFSADPNKDNDTLVRGAAEAICSLFQNYAGKLDKLYADTTEDFNNNLTQVNKILTNIRDLNKSIREAEIHGDKALEMRDERNRQIDELAEYLDIKVTYSMEDVGAGIMVEKLTIRLDDANPDPLVTTDSSMLVDGLYVTQLSVPEQKPLTNQFFGSNDPHYKDIKDYNYLKEYHVDNIADAPAGSVLQLDNDGIPVRDEDGKLICLVGTNKVEEATQLENDNFTIQLGKLLDTHDEEWKNVTTTYTQVGYPAVAAVYGYEITSSGQWDYGDKIKIGGTEFTVGPDPNEADRDPTANYVSISIVNKSSLLASFIALNLPDNADYNISSRGNYVTFTAKTPGEVKAGAEPVLTLTVAGAGDVAPDKANVSMEPRKELTAGEDATKPADTTNSTTTDPITGTTKTIRYTEVDGATYRVVVETEHTREVALDDNDLHGSLQAQRELLTKEGEFASEKDIMIDENAAIKRGIPYYIKSFDLLAQKFAEEYNKLNQGYAVNEKGNYINDKGEELLLDDIHGVKGPISKYNGFTDAQMQNLLANNYASLDKDGNPVVDMDKLMKDLGGWPQGGPLFSNRNDGDDTTGINAHNIDVSYSWSHGNIGLVPKFEHLFLEDGTEVEHSTQNINADHMVSLIDMALTYTPQDLTGSDAVDPSKLFEGSFNDMFSNLMGVEAKDANVTNIKLNTSYTALVDLDSSREGVSGVDLNDEAMNMMQYQKAMNASMRLMTAIDEVLDRLISNTGVAGR